MKDIWRIYEENASIEGEISEFSQVPHTISSNVTSSEEGDLGNVHFWVRVQRRHETCQNASVARKLTLLFNFVPFEEIRIWVHVNILKIKGWKRSSHEWIRTIQLVFRKFIAEPLFVTDRFELHNFDMFHVFTPGYTNPQNPILQGLWFNS